MADSGVIEGATATGTTGGGTHNWSSPTNALTSNNFHALAVETSTKTTRTTKELKVTNFSAAIPAGSTIDGIEVFIERSAIADTGAASDLTVVLTGITGATANKAVLFAGWGASDSEITYGGSTDKWNASSISLSEVNSSSFGVILTADLENGFAGSTEAHVDRIAATVHYTVNETAVAVPVKSFSLAGQVPVVGTSAKIEAPAKSFSLAGKVSAVASGVSLASPAATKALAGFVPSVLLGINVASPVGLFSLDGQAPNLLTGVNVQAPAKPLFLAEQAPAVGTSAVIGTPVKGFGSIGAVPAISTGAAADAPPKAYSLAGQAPAVGVSASVVVSGSSFALVGMAPAVFTGASVKALLKPYLLSGAAPKVLARTWTLVAPVQTTWTRL